MRYVDPNQPGSKVQFKAQYENFIGGKWVPPVKGEYFDNISPVDGKVFTRAPRSSVEDIELALDAAHAAKVLLKFKLLEWQRRPIDSACRWAADTPYLNLVHTKWFAETDFEAWVRALVNDLVRTSAAQMEGDVLVNT